MRKNDGHVIIVFQHYIFELLGIFKLICRLSTLKVILTNIYFIPLKQRHIPTTAIYPNAHPFTQHLLKHRHLADAVLREAELPLIVFLEDTFHLTFRVPKLLLSLSNLPEGDSLSI